LGYLTIELYKYVKTEYEKKRFHGRGNFEEMFEAIVDIFDEGNNISFNKIRLKYLSKGSAHVSHATGESEWYTPFSYIEAIHRTMGGIDVDPASTEEANKIIKAKIFYTKKDNGLNKTWRGNVFMNPPYAQPLIVNFCKAFVDKFHLREIKQGCVLVNNATETGWFQELLKKCVGVCFPKSRIRFVDKDMVIRDGSPLQGQAILYFGGNTKGFEAEFAKFGTILWK